MALGALTLSFPGHTVAVKTCSQSVLVKRSFLTLIHRVPPLPVSALWASSEWCNKAGDG